MEDLIKHIKELLKDFDGSEPGNYLLMDEETEKEIDIDFAFEYENESYQIVGYKNMWRTYYREETRLQPEEQEWEYEAEVVIYLDEEIIGNTKI